MKIIYVHHAQRNIGVNHNDPELRQLEDITELGIKDAEILAEHLKNTNITAIVSSPYIRCMHTAQIINRYHSASLLEDDRFNEMSKGEEWGSFLKRNMEAIKDIVSKYSDDDTILCVTSGVNLSAFICFFYNITPSNYTPWSQAVSTSPINFTIGKKMLD